ncbi:hypothetical protein ADH70_003885 [Blautia pseudococcoides]|uniref:Uncharacterized protein n=1 Tax=Blautia pseudococcoides TaxID=1796616 RepID=A0A1C7I8C9_9FIRM|nr:hypothetical protein A4V09_05520 [Blautia pseudococcoides]ASU28076.1 hypothetical protein ADH70_003885 [Blautia pseudococcoides]
MKFLCKSVTVQPDTCGAGDGDVCGNRTVQDNRISVSFLFCCSPKEKESVVSFLAAVFILEGKAADFGRFGDMYI